MKISLEKKILFGFILNIILVVIFGWLSFKRSQIQKKAEALQNNNYKIILSTTKLSSILNSHDNYSRSFAVTGDEKRLENLNESRYSALRELESLRTLLKNDGDQKNRLDKLQNLITVKFGNTDKFIEYLKYKTFEAAKEVAKDEAGIKINNSIIQNISQIQEAENLVFDQKKKKSGALEQTLRITLSVIFFCLTVLLFVVFFIIRQQLKSRIDAELLLERNYQLIRSLIDNTNSPIFIKKINGQYLLVNKQFESLFHRKNEELIGKTDHDIFPKEIADLLRAGDIDVIGAKKEIKSEENFPHNEEIHKYEVVKFPLLDLDKNIFAVGGIATDITDRSISELSLRESELEVQTIFNSAPEAIVVINDEGKITKWNPRAESLFGWTAAEALGKTMHEMIMPMKYRERHLNGVKHFLNTGEGPILNKTIEVTALNKNNIEFDIELTVSHAKIKDKYIFIAFVTDITERKLLQKKGEESAKFLNTIIENIPSMISIKDADELRYILINKAEEAVLGIKKEDVIGKTIYDFFPKEQADLDTDQDRELLAKGGLLDIPEELITTKDGQNWLHTRKILIKNEKSRPTYLLEISENITEQKNLEDKEKASEKELVQKVQQIQLILENIGEGVIVVDKYGEIVLSNHMADEIIGIREDDAIFTPVDWAKDYELFYPDEITIFPSQNLPLEKALRGESTDDLELIIQDPVSKVKKRVKVTGNPIKDENNNIIAAVTTIKDITQFKQLEESLKKSEAEYRKLIGYNRQEESKSGKEEKK